MKVYEISVIFSNSMIEMVEQTLEFDIAISELEKNLIDVSSISFLTNIKKCDLKLMHFMTMIHFWVTR